MDYKTKAFAKINVFLKVCGKYPNGYHRLLMLMQEIGVGDDIEISFDADRKFEVELICSDSGIEVSRNLCYKAAKLFYERLSIKFPDINCEYTAINAIKNTPSQAGLGGGSSDAAAVLKVLQKHYSNPFTYDELIDMAAKLGADVPFFITGGTALCEGIGEKVTNLPSLSGLNLILVKPPVGVPTGECFTICDEYSMPFDEESYRAFMLEFFDSDVSPINRIKTVTLSLTNDLESPAIKLVPRIDLIKTALRNTNPVFTMMSGSGSTVFSIYEDKKAADEALNTLRSNEELSDCYIIQTVTI